MHFVSRLSFAAVIGVTMAAGLPTQVVALTQVQNPRVDFRHHTVGLDNPQPRFSWELTSNDRGVYQKKYQVQVATSAELLAEDKPDLWDSGAVESEDTIGVIYRGKALPSNQKIFWRVRSFDGDSHPTSWSAPATVTTAIMDADQWESKWIGTGESAGSDLDFIKDSNWIWSDYPQDEKDAEWDDTRKTSQNAVRYFKRTFDVPEGADLGRAVLYYTGDNVVDIMLNGERIAHSSKWDELKAERHVNHLRSGEPNTLITRVRNEGSAPNAAGLVLTLVIPTADGEFVLHTDEQWVSSRGIEDGAIPANLITESREAADWQPVRILGTWGVPPWHKVRSGTHPVLPILRKQISVNKEIRQALVHVAAPGHYRLSINGARVGDHFLDTPWSKFEKTIYYRTYDVSDHLKSGDNALGIMLGKGFYNTLGDRRIHGVHSHNPLAVNLQMHIHYADGTEDIVVTDEQWKWTEGPYSHNTILAGSDYDAGRLPAGWDKPGFDDSGWKRVRVTATAGGKMKAAFSGAMRTFEEFQPVKIDEPKPGHFVYDFGQNASATPRMTVSGKKGDTIKLVWAEQRKDNSPNSNDGKGDVDQAGIGFGFISYTLAGDQADETFFDEFFYTGYQYLGVTGAVPQGHPNPDNKPVIKSLTSVHVRSDQPIIGKHSTSNTMFDRIENMVSWAVKSNMAHVFTDCPTREKLGWLEQSWLMWPSSASRFDMATFGEKIAGDIRDSQLPDGQILTVAPSYPDFAGGFHYTQEWGAAGVFIPWYLYQWYDHEAALAENYAMMKGYVDYVTSTSDGLIAAPGLGDWFDYLPGERLGPSLMTPTSLTATAVHTGCLDIVSSAALVLGKADDHKKYARLAKETRVAFNERYRTSAGLYEHTTSPQTANAMALVFNMVPETERPQAVQAIVDDLEKRDWQQTSGDVGYRFLINALSQAGRSDVIYKILNRDELGSYAYLVNSGWTSLPEAWNANRTTSMNHCMLGHIQEWFTQYMVGIAPDPAGTAFSRVILQPTPGDSVTSASGHLDSARGRIEMHWIQEDEAFRCAVILPPNTTAELRLPVPEGCTITDVDMPLDQHVKRAGRADDREVLIVENGSYEFLCQYPPSRR